MSEEETCEGVVIQEYKDSVNIYLRNGCTEFHSGVVLGIEHVLKRLDVTPAETVRIYNAVWQLWHDEVKNNPKIKKHFRTEDMSVYCPKNDCSECTLRLCDKFGPVYEGCNCDECKTRREEIRSHIQK